METCLLLASYGLLPVRSVFAFTSACMQENLAEPLRSCEERIELQDDLTFPSCSCLPLRPAEMHSSQQGSLQTRHRVNQRGFLCLSTGDIWHQIAFVGGEGLPCALWQAVPLVSTSRAPTPSIMTNKCLQTCSRHAACALGNKVTPQLTHSELNLTRVFFFIKQKDKGHF